jgi:ABC-type multidrug transport system ATPase subunit
MQVMTVVKLLTAFDITIAATIHSPTPLTFALFDRLLILQRGRCVYFGPNSDEAVDYFKHNFAVWCFGAQ